MSRYCRVSGARLLVEIGANNCGYDPNVDTMPARPELLELEISGTRSQLLQSMNRGRDVA